jgi:hypothetical protein
MKPTNLPFLSLYLFLFFLLSGLHIIQFGAAQLYSRLIRYAHGYVRLDFSWSNRLTMSSSSTHVSATATATTIAIPKTTFISDDPVASRTSYLSSTSAIMIACIIPIIAMMYLVVLSWAYQYARKSPKALNKTSGVWLQKYAPGMDSSS